MPNPPVSPQSPRQGRWAVLPGTGGKESFLRKETCSRTLPPNSGPLAQALLLQEGADVQMSPRMGLQEATKGKSQGGKEQKREMHMGLQPSLHVRNILEQRVGPRTGPESPALPTPGCVPGQPGCEGCPVFCFFRLALGYLTSLWEGGKMEKTP